VLAIDREKDERGEFRFTLEMLGMEAGATFIYVLQYFSSRERGEGGEKPLP
jgi:hypothetical protein